MLAIIGGTGFGEFAGLADVTAETVTTPYGEAYVEVGILEGRAVAFIPRHGHPPSLPPHRINYRANIHALAQLGATAVLSINAVGTVDENLKVPHVVIPDQIIDYTWGREHTFYHDEIHHIDLTYPFSEALRTQILAAAEQVADDAVPVSGNGVYGCTQGPRLETAAEIRRLRLDGCDVVGMTAMPEAGLARERQLPYASICVTVNAGAGINDQAVSMDEIADALATGMAFVRDLLHVFELPQSG